MWSACHKKSYLTNLEVRNLKSAVSALCGCLSFACFEKLWGKVSWCQPQKRQNCRNIFSMLLGWELVYSTWYGRWQGCKKNVNSWFQQHTYLLTYMFRALVCKKWCKDKAEICNLSIFKPKNPDLLLWQTPSQHQLILWHSTFFCPRDVILVC